MSWRSTASWARICRGSFIDRDRMNALEGEEAVIGQDVGVERTESGRLTHVAARVSSSYLALPCVRRLPHGC